MLANPGKSQVMFLTSSKDHILTPLPINQNLIESKQSVELLGIEIEDKLKFESHISKICGSAAGQINSLYRFNKYLIPQARNLAANSFILSNFTYCPLVWHFCPNSSNKKIESINRRAIKFSSGNNYPIVLCTNEIRRLRKLAVEVHKTVNGLNPSYMNNIFSAKNCQTSSRFENNLQTTKYNQIAYGRNSLRVLGQILWNSLPNTIKSEKNINKFKKFIIEWGKPGCPNYSKFISYYEAIK